MHWARLDMCSELQSENATAYRSGISAHLTALDLKLLAGSTAVLNRIFTYVLRVACRRQRWPRWATTVHLRVGSGHCYSRHVSRELRNRVCHASLIPRYEWLPAFDDSRRTPNKKSSRMPASLDRQSSRWLGRMSTGRVRTQLPGRVAEPEVPDKRAAR